VTVLVGASGIILEPSDPRFEFFLILAVLLWWFLSHIHEVFDEICVRQCGALLVHFGCHSIDDFGFTCIVLCFHFDSSFLTWFR
jgi:hypothetical protein